MAKKSNNQLKILNLVTMATTTIVQEQTIVNHRWLDLVVTPHRCQIITLPNKHKDKLYTTLTLSGIFMPVNVLPFSVFRLTLSGIQSVYAT